MEPRLNTQADKPLSPSEHEPRDARTQPAKSKKQQSISNQQRVERWGGRSQSEKYTHPTSVPSQDLSALNGQYSTFSPIR
ncbi:hypothetical protein E2C01_076404 [Portunus trituberculatus]|uniref:Uncharacterized protein n=1 Tax=Portunus trituberculatus TaxID=210409 RepID=A0A5B7I8N2_PORTR|nr:hypothetical protein [Portunus trituberculatus]